MALTTRPTDQKNPDQEKDRERERNERQREREREQEEREREREHEASRDEKSKPSGKQDATLPGSTPETSSQMPKPGESGDKGKGPLKFDPNAPAVDTVAQRDKMQVEGQLDYGKRPGRPDPFEPDSARARSREELGGAGALRHQRALPAPARGRRLGDRAQDLRRRS